MQVSKLKGFHALVALGLFIALAPVSHAASDALQCVPYARVVSGVEIYGDAHTWWDQADGRYDRGTKPRKGAVMVFAPAGSMSLGHIAVVSKIINSHEVLIRHANWSQPGAIEEDVRVRDVSDDGDWSAVRVWNSPTDQMGARSNPIRGFIYASKARLNPFRPDQHASNARYAYLTPSPRPAAVAKVEQVASAKASAPTATQVAYRSNIAKAKRSDVFIIEYGDGDETAQGGADRSLADIIQDVRRNARI